MRPYIVQECKKITPSTLLLTLRRNEAERPLAFQPGQYAAINYERDGRKSTTRCFSFVSSPTEQNVLQFSMRVRGRFTSAISKLIEGDVVNVVGPFGGFVFDTEHDQRAILMAGGIGVTPFMSIMRYLSALHARNEVTLLYSCPTQEDIPFGDELLTIEKAHPNLKTIFVIGNGPVDKLPAESVASGFISPELLGRITGKKYDAQRFFICGPPGFMNAMLKTLIKNGVPKQHILTEAFTQSSPRQTSILRSWPANVYALGAVGLIFGGLTVAVVDLLRWLPPSSEASPISTNPYLITNARQQQLDQLVNSIPPSPSVITTPGSDSTQTAPTVNPQPTTLSPIYQAPIPRTTASAPAP